MIYISYYEGTFILQTLVLKSDLTTPACYSVY